MHLKLLLAILASVLMIASARAQEGARAYFLLPAGTNDAELTVTLLHTENAAGVFNSGTVTPSYRHTFDVQGDAGTFLIGLPLGALSATLNTPGGPLGINTNVAQGDLFLGGTLGLVGAPALSPMAYAQYKPGLAVDFSTRLFLPTGDYNPSRLLNLGQNRWLFEALLPISYALGDSLLDPKLTTFELIPSVQVFGDNNNPFPPATVSSEAPLFGLEGHITHSFGQAVWASVDGVAEYGGETSINGIGNGDAQQSVSLGATLGLTLSQSVALRINYQQQVYSKTAGTDSREFMATSAFLF